MKNKCNHKGYWRSAGNTIIQGPGVAILINALFCKNCGTVKRDEFNYQLPKQPSIPSMSIPNIMMRPRKI